MVNADRPWHAGGVLNPEFLGLIGQRVQGVFRLHAHLLAIYAEVPELHAAVGAHFPEGGLPLSHESAIGNPVCSKRDS